MIIILLNRTFLGQQSHSGGQLLWDVVRHALTSSNGEQLGHYQPNCMWQLWVKKPRNCKIS